MSYLVFDILTFKLRAIVAAILCQIIITCNAQAAEKIINQTVKVIAITDEGVLHLKGGAQAVLSGLYFPRIESLSTKILPEVTDYLSQQLLIDELVLSAPTHDRHGRLQARFLNKNRKWLDQIWVSEGWALFEGRDLDSKIADQLLENEDQARIKRRGYWKTGLFSHENTYNINGIKSKFNIVRGTVAKARVSLKNNSYIHFKSPSDLKEVTIVISAKLHKSFKKKHGIDLKDLINKEIEVRGWFHQYRGPRLWLSDITALRIVSPLKRAIIGTNQSVE